MPASLPWRERLLDGGDADRLRTALRARHPAFVAPPRLIILGAADEGRRLAGLCRRHGIAIAAIADDNPTLAGTALSETTIVRVDALAGLDRDIPVVIASHRTLKAAQRLLAMGFMNVAPFALLQMIRPADFPPHEFYDRWLEDLHANRAAYVALYDRLADDFSRSVLDSVIGYRLSCNPSVLAPVVEWDLYGPRNLLSYGDHEVYVDGGSYDGDTIRLFIDRVGGRYDRILAFEPDPATFARLAANFAGEPRIEPINQGLFSRTTTLRFNGAGTRASGLTGDNDGIAVPVTSIDEILGADRVTCIKMNIEGAEQEALRGAARSIARWQPKLAISAYHRAADLWQIPALVRSLEPGYRLYLRQHDGGVIETVLYALP